MNSTSLPIHEKYGFQFVDEGPVSDVPPIVLLHGMLGAIGNWTSTVQALAAQQYRVLVPVLPVYALPMSETNVHGLVEHVRAFIETMDLGPVVLGGNSLGGHVALFYTLQYPRDVIALLLSGSSGIYEVEVGTATMRRRDREFIRERAALTFYDPVHATNELVDEALNLVNNRNTALRLIKMARSAQSETVTNQLSKIEVPTMLIWGSDDVITPPEVARQFQSYLPKSTLVFLTECGHAPMIEHPKQFNAHTLEFLHQTIGHAAVTSASGSY